MGDPQTPPRQPQELRCRTVRRHVERPTTLPTRARAAGRSYGRWTVISTSPPGLATTPPRSRPPANQTPSSNCPDLGRRRLPGPGRHGPRPFPVACIGSKPNPYRSSAAHLRALVTSHDTVPPGERPQHSFDAPQPAQLPGRPGEQERGGDQKERSSPLDELRVGFDRACHDQQRDPAHGSEQEIDEGSSTSALVHQPGSRVVERTLDHGDGDGDVRLHAHYSWSSVAHMRLMAPKEPSGLGAV